jgi:hypothetical protein
MKTMLLTNTNNFDSFSVDTFGFYPGPTPHFAMLTMLARKSGAERFFTFLHKGDIALRLKKDGDDASLTIYKVFPKGYRVFRKPLGRGLVRYCIIPTGTMVEQKKQKEETLPTKQVQSPDVDPSIHPTQREAPPTKPVDDLFDGFQLISAGVWRGDSPESLWSRIMRESPVPLLPQWGPVLMGLFKHHAKLDELRVAHGLQPRNCPRLVPLELAICSTDGWGGALINLDGHDLSVAAYEGLRRGRLKFEDIAA